ncbi:hypothetical protein Q4O60_16290 [Aeribacillus pallidus]|jgi:hypothetical protein|uniref:NEAT domain-containing protein n=1 Tax=Aeribacillus pallidus TaxID=33936 RepID=A0A223E1Q5_9BACI|nr:hypothetical protein [Aeribacillus pallidus]ASS89159.1 hypothetical protein AP3564_01745 [Aeribacillus pallidus]MDR9797998.1 hypothetical protein [Aeribacillus pallidus]
MIQTNLSYKRTVAMFISVLLLSIAIAVSASAATLNYQFLDSNGNYSSHASSFIVGDAVIDGNSATITLKDASYIGDLLVWDGSDYVSANRTVDADGNVQFTFDVYDFDVNLAVQLYVNAGPHSGYIPLFIQWL